MISFFVSFQHTQNLQTNNRFLTIDTNNFTWKCITKQ